MIDHLPVSILDRSHLTTATDAREALRRTLERAQYAERLGFSRFWVSEHHGVPGVAGASPAVLLAAIGSVTRTIRLGSGGVMVPNHQPLVIAEQFGMLDALFPGRVDLGVGRSLGFVRAVRQALRRETYSLEEYAADIKEIVAFFANERDVLASPGAGANVRLFILASAGSADIAARLGLPLVVGGPKILTPDDDGLTLIDRYRRDFRPSPGYEQPYVILNTNVLVADTTEAAADLALSEAWAYVEAKTQGAFLPLQAPAAVRAKSLDERQPAQLAQMTANAITGTAQQVTDQLHDMLDRSQADDLLISGSFFDQAAALHSDELVAEAFGLSGQG